MGTQAENKDLVQHDIFVSGTQGYHTYRIPALLVTRAGTLLAFCEGRVNDAGDHGRIHLLLRRSEDNGRSWSRQQVVWEDGPNTCGNPCPVEDSATGTIWLPANWNRPGQRSEYYFNAYDTRYVYMLSSQNDGRTWSRPCDITLQVKRKNWGWYATGPCTGIELQRGPHRGRLLVPCCHTEVGQGARPMFSHVIYSDDHGKSWLLGGRTAEGCSESQAAELNDGRLMLNIRHYPPVSDVAANCRRVSISVDGGDSWSPVQYEQRQPEPYEGCQGSVIRSKRGTAANAEHLLFSNPASSTGTRERLTVRKSSDDGTTWSTVAVLHAGPAAYSSLATLKDGRIACLYERGTVHAHEKITFAAFSHQVGTP